MASMGIDRATSAPVVWLRAYLRAGGGQAYSHEALQEGLREGYGPGALRRAWRYLREAEGGVTRLRGFGAAKTSEWRLP